MYKTSLLTAAVLASCNLGANAAQHNQDSSGAITTGAYVGALAGYNSGRVETNESFFFEAPTQAHPAGLFGLAPLNTNNSPLSASSSKGNFSLAGVLGYRYVFQNNFILGAEVEVGKNFGDYTSAVQLNTANVGAIALSESGTKIKNTFFVKPVAVLGYRINEKFAIFGKIGANIAKFDYNNEFGAFAVGGATIFRTSDSRTFTRTGLVLGLGAEYAFSNHISVVADASYTHFGSSSVTLTNPSTPANPLIANATHTATVKPRFITARIGAIYRF